MVTAVEERIAPPSLVSTEAAPGRQSAMVRYREHLLLICHLLSGCLLGLSAPGCDQWYLAWVALSPLIVSCIVCPSVLSVFRRGLSFGVGYYLVYCNWALAMHPLDWLGYNDGQSLLMVLGAWTFLVFTQAFNVAIFAQICRMLPCTRSNSNQGARKSWYYAPLLIPLVWMVCVNRLGNAHLLFGLQSDLLNRWTIPWGMLEYSQYRQEAIVQLASVVGGIGICFLIVMVNTLIAMLVSTYMRSSVLTPVARPTGWPGKVQVAGAALGALLFSFGSGMIAMAIYFLFRPRPVKEAFPNRPSRPIAVAQLIALVAMIVASTAVVCRTAQLSCQSYSKLTVLQANDSFRLRTKLDPIKPGVVLPFLSMVEDCPPGLCIGSETALPLPMRIAKPIQESLAKIALQHGNDICVGCIDFDEHGNKFNSACGVSAAGRFLPSLHHKRYLVPFLEHTPIFFQSLRAALRFPTAWSNFQHGTKATVFDLSCGRVAPLICYEISSPELCSQSVQEGGQLLVLLGDQVWFRNSIIGNQMIAFCVMRAVENRRYVVFSSNTGPSAVIDPGGKIKRWSVVGKKQLLIDEVGFNSTITPFCYWISRLGRL